MKKHDDIYILTKELDLFHSHHLKEEENTSPYNYSINWPGKR